MGYPRIEKPHRFVCICLFSPLEHASSMVKYLNIRLAGHNQRNALIIK